MAPISQNSSQRPTSLLLLPPAPSPPSYAALKAAYGAPLSSVLRELSQSGASSNECTVLEIALPCPHLHGQQDAPRSRLYGTTQGLVAGLYKLVCVVSGQQSVDVQDSQGIDPRVLLLSYPRDGRLEHTHREAATEGSQGPFVDIQSLARCGRPWETVYSVESEEGERVLRNFLAANEAERSIKRVRGGVVSASSPEEQAGADAPRSSVSRHHSVAVGGTWDHLHIGHKLLLTMTAFIVEGADPRGPQSERTVVIGITGDELLRKKKYAEFLQSWDCRQQSVASFMRAILDFSPFGHTNITTEERCDPGPNGHAVLMKLPSNLVVSCVELWDPYGPTITERAVSALVISAETAAGAKAVNDKRAEMEWPLLEVYEVDVVDADEDGEGRDDGTFQYKISSTEIRRLQSEKRISRNKA